MIGVLIAGSRNYNDYEEMKKITDALLINISKDITIISGGARGADRLAERYAKERGFVLRIFPAKWDEYGKSAGYRRNKEMHEFLNTFNNKYCICFWDGESKGTAHNFQLIAKSPVPPQLRVFNFITKEFSPLPS